jgi:hypothetical protein
MDSCTVICMDKYKYVHIVAPWGRRICAIGEELDFQKCSVLPCSLLEGGLYKQDGVIRRCQS